MSLILKCCSVFFVCGSTSVYLVSFWQVFGLFPIVCYYRNSVMTDFTQASFVCSDQKEKCPKVVFLAIPKEDTVVILVDIVTLPSMLLLLPPSKNESPFFSHSLTHHILDFYQSARWVVSLYSFNLHCIYYARAWAVSSFKTYLCFLSEYTYSYPLPLLPLSRWLFFNLLTIPEAFCLPPLYNEKCKYYHIVIYLLTLQDSNISVSFWSLDLGLKVQRAFYLGTPGKGIFILDPLRFLSISLSHLGLLT